MAVNKAIVISAGGITAIGVASAWSQHKGITRIVLGGYLLAIFLSVADIFGGSASTIAGAVGMVALVTVFLAEGLPLLQNAGIAVAPPASGSTGAGGSGGKLK